MKNFPSMTTQNSVTVQDNGKTTAIVGYLTIIGWLVAYFAMHKDNKTSFASFHLRQFLLLFICAFAYNIITYFIILAVPNLMLARIFQIGYLLFVILWLIGFIGALQEKESAMPVIGMKAQTMFPNI